MSPLDGELRAALHSRAATLAPSPDPLAGVERRARGIRRRRSAAAVVGSVLAVAAIALAVPALTPSAAPVLPAAPSPQSAPAELSLAAPWAYRGDPSLVTAAQRESYAAQWAATRGAEAAAVEWVPLYGERYESSGQDEVLYAARASGGPAVVGLAVSTQAGADFRSEQPFSDGDDSLLVLRLNGDEVDRVLAIASPAAERLEYSPDGVTYRDLTGSAPGVGLSPLEGDTTQARVRVAVGGSVLAEPLPAAEPSEEPTVAEPANLLDWPSRGVRSAGPSDEQVLRAFAQGIGADPGAGTSYRAVFSGSTDAGVRFTYGQAWADGQPAYTVGLATGGTQGEQLFLGPVTPDAPAVLAFVLCCEPGSSVETLVVVPVPGTGQVLYDDDATGPFRPVGEGQDLLDGVVLVDRDPRAQDDRLQLLDGDGNIDRPLFQAPVSDQLCALRGCG